MKNLVKMKLVNVKNVLATCAIAGSLVVSSLSAFADNIGTVDTDKLISSYNKAQSVFSDIKVREAEIRKMQAEFVRQIEEVKKNQPKNPIAAEQLEKDLTTKLNTKITEYRDWTSNKQREIDNDLDTTINAVAKSKGIDVVLSKQAVFLGGTDITNEVLSRLNAAAGSVK